ncbi:MAG: O-methyltransferase [Aquificae bacterium]|nr:O-methyltransferase [Aquificota bacterium]
MIINPKIEKYLEKLSFEEKNDPIIKEMEEIAKKENFPIVGSLVGRFLYIITKQKNPSLIVELGSGYGYSAYWFAKALNKGKVVLIDYQEKNIEKAKEFFKRAGLEKKAEFKVGDALEIAKEYKNIDILFLDLEKSRYLEAIQSLEKNLSENALIIADNVLWHGKVINEKPDKKTLAIKQFNEYMFKHYFSAIIPIRDGILLSIKNS